MKLSKDDGEELDTINSRIEYVLDGDMRIHDVTGRWRISKILMTDNECVIFLIAYIILSALIGTYIISILP